jgi:hypothetical protein
VGEGDALEVILGEGSLSCLVKEVKEGLPWKIEKYSTKK